MLVQKNTNIILLNFSLDKWDFTITIFNEIN